MSYCQQCADLLRENTTLRSTLSDTLKEQERLQAEKEQAMAVLRPNMPESGLVDACRQVKQAAISESDNAAVLTDQLARISEEYLNHCKELDAAESTLSRLREQLAWQPIETAPKDGTQVLLFKVGRSMVQGWFSRGDSYSMPHWSTPSGLFDPTHWMPKPDDPVSDGSLSADRQPTADASETPVRPDRREDRG